MTKPVLAPNPPIYRAPREYCKHGHTVEHTVIICAIKLTETVCVQCGSVVE